MALTYLGDTCFGLQDFPPARVAYQRSLAAYPSGRLADRAKYGLGRTLAALGERDQALTVMQELTKQSKPEWVDRAWLQIGLIRKSAGQFAEAVEAFATLERVVAAEPAAGRKPSFSAHWSWSGSSVGPRPSRCCERWRPTRSAAHGARAALELATIELERNQPDAALATLESALKRFPQSPLLPAMHFRMAEVLREAKSPGGRPGAVRAGRRGQSQRSLGRRRAAAGRPGGAGPGRSEGGPAPGRHIRGPVSAEPAQVRGPADRGPRRRSARKARRGRRDPRIARRLARRRVEKDRRPRLRPP